MSYITYGLLRTRITLYDTDGTTPLKRITLQKEMRDGLVLAWKPEGVATRLGSGASWANNWTHHGFRASLAIKWDFGMNSSVETWTGAAWGTAAEVLTPIALSQIFNKALLAPCLVEPHTDKAYSFLAQPDPGKAFVLRDVKGVAHSGLELDLVATTVAAIPDWASL